jgi:hypothetical protein
VSVTKDMPEHKKDRVIYKTAFTVDKNAMYAAVGKRQIISFLHIKNYETSNIYYVFCNTQIPKKIEKL